MVLSDTIAAVRPQKKLSRVQAVDKNWRAKREFIIETAAELFAQYGFKAASMDSLAERAEVNKATLYYYYDSKAKILYDIVLVTIERFEAIVKTASKMAKAIDALDYVVTQTCTFTNAERNIALVYFQEEGFLSEYLSDRELADVNQRGRQIMKAVFTMIQRGIDSGEIAPCDVRYVGRLLIGMILWVYRWPEPEIDHQRVVAAAKSMVLDGLRARPSP